MYDAEMQDWLKRHLSKGARLLLLASPEFIELVSANAELYKKIVCVFNF